MADSKAIAFSRPMTNLILAGKKRQTRRIAYSRAPAALPGTRLWVRESARVIAWSGKEVEIEYQADGHRCVVPWPDRLAAPRLGQCIPNGVHREAARIFLHLDFVRSERLHEISESDAHAEGFASRTLFQNTWIELYGLSSWEDNPEVYVYGFHITKE